MKAQREAGGRILLGDNTGGNAAADQIPQRWCWDFKRIPLFILAQFTSDLSKIQLEQDLREILLLHKSGSVCTIFIK